MGRKAVEKHRLPKGYRHRLLDRDLRGSRIKMEVRLFREARRLGVPVPILYDVDLGENRIVMEFVDGPTAKDVLASDPDGGRELCHKMGLLAGRLHAGDIVHGDLTTSNMILRGERLYLVDFGLGEKRGDVEAKGVDLHLLREAFMSAHSDRAGLFEEVLRGYRDAYREADPVIAKVKEIEKRGRYLRGS
ncbi:MAG: KEOPS complex kinase/ATPase Bud32 [Thermoplasmata archaeon]